jgi:multicomponent Na+:H+ antiporter subunit D
VSDLLLFLPVLIPLGTGIATLPLETRPKLQRLLSLAGALCLFAAGIALFAEVARSGVVHSQAAGWPAPAGITLAADLLSVTMVALAGLTGVLITVYSLGSGEIADPVSSYHPLLHVLLAGVCGSFLTADVFNLYVWFEVMLIASFTLLCLGGERLQVEGAMKYVALNLFASLLFLAATGLLYGLAGTLNMADVSRWAAESPPPPELTAVATLFLIAFGIKAAIFPLFFWLPASYHVAPAPVTAIFSALLTKVGVYAILRCATLLFPTEAAASRPLLLALAAATMVTGVLGAASQYDLRRLLSFHIVSQIGYLLLGVALLTPLSLAATILFVVHLVLAKTALFLVSGVVRAMTGTSDLKKLGGLSRTHPGLALLFLVPALSLAGVPPLPGFWAKYALIRSALEAGEYAVVGAALAVSLMTLFSMVKIWNEAFGKEVPEGGATPSPGGGLLLLKAPAAALALLTVALGLGAEPLSLLAQRGAQQLLDPVAYRATVLGDGR